MSTAAAQLVEASAALDRGDESAALAAMLAAWRASPSPSLAEAIERLDERLRTRRPSIKKSLPLAQREAEWARVAAEGRADDLGWLLAQPWPGKWDGVHARLLLLVNHKDDPRLARHLARVVDELPFDTIASLRLYEVACSYLVAARDVRALPILERTDRAKWHYLDYEFRPLLARTATALRAATEGAPPDADDGEALVALRARLGLDRAEAPSTTADAEALLAAIAAAPDDDGPRQVYADLLLEAGDPRGEFITLQLARARGKRPGAAAARREKELLAANREAWLGPLRNATEDDGVIFARGFVDTVALGFRHRMGRAWRAIDVTAVLDQPVWRTVRRLDLALLDDLERAVFLKHLTPAAFPSLRELLGLSANGLSWLLAHEELVPLTALSTGFPTEPNDRLARLAQLRWLRTGVVPEWVARSAVWSQIEELEISLDIYSNRVGAAWALVAAHPTSALRRFSCIEWDEHYGDVVYRFERDEEGRFTRLTVEGRANRRKKTYGTHVAAHLESLPPDALTSIAIAPMIDVWQREHDRIEAATARSPRVTAPRFPWRAQESV
jgi:uncharacterized protein (TIGR02996 family)